MTESFYETPATATRTETFAKELPHDFLDHSEPESSTAAAPDPSIPAIRVVKGKMRPTPPRAISVFDSRRHAPVATLLIFSFAVNAEEEAADDQPGPSFFRHSPPPAPLKTTSPKKKHRIAHRPATSKKKLQSPPKIPKVAPPSDSDEEEGRLMNVTPDRFSEAVKAV
jgi:hypothetical protein